MNTERFHKDVWSRFVRMPYGHIIDYVGNNGETVYPTPEQCRCAIPNGMGWWTPIENGAFFTGLYAYTLIKSYDASPTDRLYREIEVLIRGLYLLQDVAQCDGFIARGVAEDGVSHYPISSDDQLIPWVLALWAYSNSSACGNKNEARDRMSRVLRALRHNNYAVPTDWGSVCLGSWEEHCGWRDVAKLVFVKRIIAELSGSEADMAEFRASANGVPPASVFTRLEIISQGFANEMINSYGKQPWICASTHLALRELISLDRENERFFRLGIYNNAVTALPMIDGILDFKQDKYKFDADWRPLIDMWEDHGTEIAPQYEMANRQNKVWMSDIVPQRREEHVVLGNAVYAALIAMASDDKRIVDEAYRKLIRGIEAVEWERLHLPMSYPVECALRFYDLLES